MKLLREVKSLHWVWFWSGNWPLLDNMIMWGAENKKFKTIIGRNCNSITVFKNGIVTEYHCQEDYDRLENFLYKKFEKNPGFIKDSFRDYLKKTSQDVKALKKINKIKTKNLSSAELADLFIEARKYFHYNAAMDMHAWYIEKFFIPKLQEYLEERLSKLNRLDKLASYISILVTPSKPSLVFKERQELFKIIKTIRRDKKMVKIITSLVSRDAIFKKYPRIAKAFDNHLLEYNWLSMLVNNPPVTPAELWKEIKQYIKDDETFKIESRRLGDNFNVNVIKQKKKIISELKPSREILKLIQGLEITAFNRTEDNAIMGKSTYLVKPLYEDIARRLGVTYNQLKEFTPEEITKFLQNEDRADLSLLSERFKLTAYVSCGGITEILIGAKARTVVNIVENQLKETNKATSLFSGTSASPGAIIGKVKVALSSKDATDIKTGDILIAPATSADFVPAMRKASAIVTEFGGITSHAAVVAREFNVPCIVGVKEITKFLKDGDKVEVNADKGIVKKV